MFTCERASARVCEFVCVLCESEGNIVDGVGGGGVVSQIF